MHPVLDGILQQKLWLFKFAFVTTLTPSFLTRLGIRIVFPFCSAEIIRSAVKWVSSRLFFVLYGLLSIRHVQQVLIDVDYEQEQLRAVSILIHSIALLFSHTHSAFEKLRLLCALNFSLHYCRHEDMMLMFLFFSTRLSLRFVESVVVVDVGNLQNGTSFVCSVALIFFRKQGKRDVENALFTLYMLCENIHALRQLVRRNKRNGIE